VSRREKTTAAAVSSRLAFRKTLIAAVAVLTLGAVFALSRLNVRHKATVIPTSLDLTVAVLGAAVDVKWNPSSLAVSNSERGALDFLDGADVRRIELNQAQLRAGHYEYVPEKPDLTCVMAVYRNHNIFVAEARSVYVNFPQTPAKPSLQEQPAGPPRASDAPLAAKRALENGTGLAQGQGDETRRIVISQLTQRGPDQEPPTHSRAVTFTPPPTGAQTAPTTRLEEPPELGGADESSPAVLPTVAGVSVAAPPINTLPIAADAPPLTFSAAAPIARVSPVVPQAARSAIHDGVSIRVAVEVDREGKVTGARPVDATDPIEKLLVPTAVRAARLWRFDPARRDGTPVPSETVVVFQFARN
jgi:TonB family protein